MCIRDSAYGVRVTVRHEDRLLTASAHGGARAGIVDALAGERVHVRGTVRPAAADDDWSRWNHVVGRLTVDEVVGLGPAPPAADLANRIRRTLAGGAAVLDDDDRSLFLGMVIGDDRGQSPVIADDFRSAGLGHLLVVSGQNVAFVLALASPLAMRVRPATRLVLLLALLVLFALLTRFEPSVLRAVVMAGLGVGSTALGFPIDGRRALGGAVALLVVVDPFLVHVVAFRLSVAATAGIVWLAGPLAERVPGPRPVVLAFATTAAAQLAVAPVLLATFGPVPLASLPANLLAGPASGPVMMWGATAGMVAGVAGGDVATVVHVPTTGLLWWIRRVAATAALGPPALVGVGALGLLTASVGLAFVGQRWARITAATVAVTVAIGSVAGAARPPAGRSEVGAGIAVVRDGSVLVVELDDPAPPRTVLERLRLAGVGRPDLVIVADGDAADAAAVVALVDRHGPLPVLAPPLHRVPDARTARPGQRVELDGPVLEVIEVQPRLVVEVR